jgi:hypothetical protein
MKKLNINHIIKVKLTDHGKDIFYHQHDEFNKKFVFSKIPPRYPNVDEDGFSTFQLWDFMNVYGPYCRIGSIDPFIENNNIYICEEDLRDVENEL